ncbi:hypothetical protein ACS0TY_020954 [Phlomoides rotata]
MGTLVLPVVVGGIKRIGSTTRRVWIFAEECELMHILKELVLKGNKCDNGFRLNSTTYHVEALPEVWEAQIKDSQVYADAVNEVLHSVVNQPHSSMDIDEEGESHPATENYTTDKTSFSVDENSYALKDKKKRS